MPRYISTEIDASVDAFMEAAREEHQKRFGSALSRGAIVRAALTAITLAKIPIGSMGSEPALCHHLTGILLAGIPQGVK